MNVAIPRSEIKAAVAGFSKVVNGRTTLPALACAMFESDADGVRATVTDLDQSASYAFVNAESGARGRCLVPMTELRELAKARGPATIEIEAVDDGVAIASSVGSNAVTQTVPTPDPEDWPATPKPVAVAPAPGFLDTYRRLAVFASTDEKRHVLNSVFVDVAGKGENPATMVATDGRRLCMWNSMSLPLKRSAIVPTTKFLAWTGLKDEAAIGLRTETVDKTVATRGLGLRCGPWSYDTRIVEGAYPNFRQVVPHPDTEIKATIRISDDDAKALATVMPGLCVKDCGDPSVRLRPSPAGGVIVASTNAERKSSAELRQGSRWEGEAMSFGVNPLYLLDALGAGFRDFAVADDLSPLCSRDGRGGTHVLMPVRLGPDPDAPEKEEADASQAQTVKPDPVKPETAEPTVPPQPVNTEPEPVRTENGAAKDKAQETANPKPGKGECSSMNTQKPKTESRPEPGGADALLKTVAETRARLREVAAGLVDVAAAAKAAAKEGKAQSQELERARATLQKLQGISL